MIDPGLITMAVQEVAGKTQSFVDLFSAKGDNKNETRGAAVGNLILPFGIGKGIGAAIGRKKDSKVKSNRLSQMFQMQTFGADDDVYQFAEGGVVNVGEGEGDETNVKPADRRKLQEWNQFVRSYQDKIKDPTLLNVKDKNLGKTYLEEYRKANPGVSLTYDDIPQIQASFRDWRNRSIELHKQGKIKINGDPGPNYEKYMPELSKIDGWMGSQTFRLYPESELVRMEDGQVKEVVKEGVVKMEKGGLGIMAQMMGTENAESTSTKKPLTSVEFGELLSNPDGTIVDRYDNPNRFSKHGKSLLTEPVGNFVDIPEGGIVIPKKLAKRFETGDLLTRRSILRQLIDNQIQDPEINEFPEEQMKTDGASMYADGGLTKGGAKRSDLKKLSGLADSDLLSGTAGSFTKGILSLLNNQSATEDNGAVSSDVTDEDRDALNKPMEDLLEEKNPKKTKFNIAHASRVLSSVAPGLYQMANAMSPDPYLAPVFNSGFDKARGTIGRMDAQTNVDDALSEIDAQAAAALQGIQNTNSPSARSEIAQVMSNAAQQKAKLKSDNIRQNVGMKNNILQMLSGVDVNQGVSDQGENIRVQNERRMDKAASENTIASVLDQDYRMLAGSQNDNERIKVLNSMSKFQNINPLDTQLYQEDPEALNYIFSVFEKTGDLKQAIDAYKQQKNKTASTAINSQRKDRYGRVITTTDTQIQRTEK